MRLTPSAFAMWGSFGLVATASSASAQDVSQNLDIIGAPVQGETGFPPAATELARDLQSLDFGLLVLITVIVLFVLALLIWIALRYNRKANPVPSRFSHNTPLEIAWTVFPIVVLGFLFAYSMPTLIKQQTIPEADINIKVTGYQWFWEYEYTDEGVGFPSYILEKEELAAHGYDDEHYLLATDTAVVIPVGATIVMQVTGADVIHSWTIPSFGVKQDAVPGRLAQLWFKAEKEGIYFGQCSELCGKDHAYMPITVKVVSPETYETWLAAAKEENAI